MHINLQYFQPGDSRVLLAHKYEQYDNVHKIVITPSHVFLSEMPFIVSCLPYFIIFLGEAAKVKLLVLGPVLRWGTIRGSSDGAPILPFRKRISETCLMDYEY